MSRTIGVFIVVEGKIGGGVIKAVFGPRGGVTITCLRWYLQIYMEEIM